MYDDRCWSPFRPTRRFWGRALFLDLRLIKVKSLTHATPERRRRA